MAETPPPSAFDAPAQNVSPPGSPSKTKPKFVTPTYTSTLIYALSYLCVEGAIVVSCSAFFYNVATPPWRLEPDGPWHSTFTRLSVWMNVCHGLSHFVNGTFHREFKQPKFKLAWSICWALSCLVQCTVTALPLRIAPLAAKVSVVVAANLVTIAVHMSPYMEAGQSVVLKALRLHMEDKILWTMHGAVLLTFSSISEDISIGVQLLNVLWPQAYVQFLGWLDALHCAPFHTWGLVQQANHASHILSIHMAWKARMLGNGHAIIWLYFFFALSSALYEPRATLPNFAADKTTKIWSKLLHPALSPIFATVPLLAAIYHTVIAAHRAIGSTGDTAAGWFGLHLCVSQVILFALRSCRFQHETALCQRIPRASGWPLVLDACLLGLLKMVMISSLQLP